MHCNANGFKETFFTTIFIYLNFGAVSLSTCYIFTYNENNKEISWHPNPYAS